MAASDSMSEASKQGRGWIASGIIVLIMGGFFAWTTFSTRKRQSPHAIPNAAGPPASPASPGIQRSQDDQTSSSTPLAFRFDGDATEWTKTPATFALSKTTHAARDGTIWIGQDAEGVLIAGMISGSPPQWPQTAGDIAAKDHLDIWIADTKPPELPPIGWGNQFGYKYLSNARQCSSLTSGDVNKTAGQLRAECRQWYRDQVKYRAAFRRLFVRHWQMAPDVVRETDATSAFESFDKGTQEKLVPLKPSGTPQIKIKTDPAEDQAYSFEIQVPWPALPPMRSLEFGEVRLLVNVFSSATGNRAAAYSSISQARKSRDQIPLRLLTLPKPREYLLTPCRYDLTKSVIDTGPRRAYLIPSDASKTYYFPTKDPDLRKALVLDNETRGYQYEPSAASRSPVPFIASYWTHRISDHEWLCGPRLAYRRNEKTSRTDFIIAADDDPEIRELARGDLLMKDGPKVWESYFGAGQCGGCPRVSLRVYYLDRSTGGITEAFSYVGIAESERNDIDIIVSPDWNTIKVFEGKTQYNKDISGTTWSLTTYCFKGEHQKYVECGKKNSVPAPSPRTIDPTAVAGRPAGH